MNILEQCRISPPDSVAELRLPLTFLDMFWPDWYPVRRLLFYEFRCSKSDFLHKIIPNRPSYASFRRWDAGNTVQQWRFGFPSVCDSDDDFSYLIGDHPRDAEKFYPLIPDLPPVIHVDNSRLVPLLAVQVTLFPNRGVSVGISNQHVVGDARTTVNFIKSWSAMCRSGGDAEFLADESLHPVHDRCLIKDPTGKLLEKNWNYMRTNAASPSLQFPVGDEVRVTFEMKEAVIQKLKDRAAMAMAMADSNHDYHVSSFTVTYGYVWSCLAKAGAAIGEEDGIDHFFFAADYRARMDPPLPPNYFGNCLGFIFLKSPRSQLIKKEGFVVAERLIGEAIHRRFSSNKEEIMKSADEWADELTAVDLSRAVATAGSPRFDVYDADFGWGKPNKFENMSTDAGFLVSICKSRDSDKDLEIGLSLPKIKMDAFTTIFNYGLNF